jgi:hypothetical protein
VAKAERDLVADDYLATSVNQTVFASTKSRLNA